MRHREITLHVADLPAVADVPLFSILSNLTSLLPSTGQTQCRIRWRFTDHRRSNRSYTVSTFSIRVRSPRPVTGKLKPGQLSKFTAAL